MIITSNLTRARGTDFVRLRPASASLRFLEILPVRRPNPSLRLTEGLRPPSASVRPGICLASAVRICPWGGWKRFTVRRPPPSQDGRTRPATPELDRKPTISLYKLLSFKRFGFRTRSLVWSLSARSYDKQSSSRPDQRFIHLKVVLECCTWCFKREEGNHIE